jgi:hypothetical protein
LKVYHLRDILHAFSDADFGRHQRCFSKMKVIMASF